MEKSEVIELKVDTEEKLEVMIDALENLECTTPNCPGIEHCNEKQKPYPCSELYEQIDYFMGRRKLTVTSANVKYMVYLLENYIELDGDKHKIAEGFLNQLR